MASQGHFWENEGAKPPRFLKTSSVTVHGSQNHSESIAREAA
jgi:hypothetical protein